MRGLADRLLEVLRGELLAFERQIKDDRPIDGGDGASPTARVRFETIAQMTKTLEKLLDLKRLERLAAQPEGEEDAAETRRLRQEMMRRLRALDARRPNGGALFSAAEPVAG